MIQSIINERKNSLERVLEYDRMDKEYKKSVAQNIRLQIKLLQELKRIMKRENLIFSESPYSMSFYLCKKDEKIDWGCKPEGSYRLSDHWGWFGYGKTHCKRKDGKTSELAICQMIEGQYIKVI